MDGSFNVVKDFEYLTKQKDSSLDIMSKLLSLANNTFLHRSSADDCIIESNLGFCGISFDRKSSICKYRVYWNDGSGILKQEDFDDLADVIAFIAARWY